MALDVTVAIGTFGSKWWADLAHERAIPSVERLGVPWLHLNRSTLQEARNDCLDAVTTEHICFVDADDELEHGYFRKMAESAADIRVPSVRYVKNGFDQGVRMPTIAGHTHVCVPACLQFGNYIVIGAVAPTALLRTLGGFRDFAWSEDYDLWLRAWKAGATFENVPRAVYRAHVRNDSRNRGQTQEAKNAAHRAIAEANGLPWPLPANHEALVVV